MSSFCCMTIFAERVTLKPVSSAYARDMFNGFTEETARFLATKPADDIEGTEALIAASRSAMDHGTGFSMAIIDRATGRFLGGAGLHRIDTSEPEAEVWIVESARRKGYGTEAFSALSDWVGKNLSHDFLSVPVATENITGRAFVESLGGIIHGEGTVRDSRGDEFPIQVYRVPRESSELA